MTIREELQRRARKSRLVAAAGLVLLTLAIGASWIWRDHQGRQFPKLIGALAALVLAATHVLGKGVACPKCGVTLTPSKEPPDFCPACGVDLREATPAKRINPIS
jgi:hypothetical protein